MSRLPATGSTDMTLNPAIHITTRGDSALSALPPIWEHAHGATEERLQTGISETKGERTRERALPSGSQGAPKGEATATPSKGEGPSRSQEQSGAGDKEPQGGRLYKRNQGCKAL